MRSEVIANIAPNKSAQSARYAGGTLRCNAACAPGFNCYMPMKLSLFTFLLILCNSAQANECPNPSSRISSNVTIKADEDSSSEMYHIRAPRIYNGMALKLLTLTAQLKDHDGTHEIALPLAIKTKGNQTGSFFSMSSDWLKIRVAANYGENLCTELVATYGI